MLFDNVSYMDVIHRFLERACNYRRDLNSSEVLLALRDVDLREGRHVGPFPRGGPLASLELMSYFSLIIRAPVVRKLASASHQINHYPVKKC